MALNRLGREFLQRCGLTPEEFTATLRTYNAPEHIVLGIIKAESSGNPEALRFEPGYPYVFDHEVYARMLGWTAPTEKALQQFSYGLMQIMLATARYIGFNHHPKNLFTPKTNVAWGVHFLHSLFVRFGSWQNAVAAYNYGHPARTLITKKYKNQDYVDRVYRYAAEFHTDAGPPLS